MKKDFYFSKLAISVLAFGIMPILLGCTDGDFDLSKVDTTVGIGGDGLQLPVSDTEDIMLNDVLELDNSDVVSVGDNGDYMFLKDGDGMAPSHPMVDAITASLENIDNDFRVEVPASDLLQSAQRSARRAGGEVRVEGVTSKYRFRGTAPHEIRAVSRAEVESDVTVAVNVSAGLKSVVREFRTVTLAFPSYMKLELGHCSPSQPDYDEATGVVTFHNVGSTADIRLNAKLVQLDFTKKSSADARLTFTPGTAGADGSVDVVGTAMMGASFDKVSVQGTAPADMYLSARTMIGAIRVRKVQGKFRPEITLRDLGAVDIDNVPDFLSGDKVSVNLHNPMVQLNVTNDMDVAGLMKGTLVAEDENGGVLARVDVPQMNIKPAGQTKICICKRTEGVDAAWYDEVKVVENISDLMRTVPKKIRFTAETTADDTREGTIELGKRYEIKASYALSAPLAFDEGARIVYADTLDGWNDDLDDIELAEGAYVEMSADVDNKIPACLTMTAAAIDAGGKEMPQSRVKVDVVGTVKPSEDGNTAATSPIVVRLSEVEKGAVKDIDGIVFRVEATPDDEGGKSIVGQTINAYRHTLTVRNIIVKLVGRVIADMN